MSRAALVDRLREIVGGRYTLTRDAQTERFRRGYRYGGGAVLAVVRPASLLETWRVLEACVAAGAPVIMQAANTGLTGGSTPWGEYDRPVVLVSTTRIAGVRLLGEGEEALCLAGSTLDGLERMLRGTRREPHSVLGSSCIGASVVGGVCNNSGGALVRRGPAYTEMALYARVSAAGELQLVNDLGIDLGDDPEAMLRRLDALDVEPFRVRRASGRGSDDEYQRHVRDVDADSPARFNADPRRLSGCSGSAGKVAVLAARLDTFPAPRRKRVFYLGTNDPADFAGLRRAVLGRFANLPVSGEYMSQRTFRLAERYGKDTMLLIRLLGTARLPAFFAVRARLDRIARRLPLVPGTAVDRLLQLLADLSPTRLPRRLAAFRDRFDHHLIVTVADEGIEEFEAYLHAEVESAGWFACDSREAASATLLRFAAAGAANRLRAVRSGEIEDIVALDVALRRNDDDWSAEPPPEIMEHVVERLSYGHFFCHVLHLDYLVRRGSDPAGVEAALLDWVARRGARFPAEHNVGHKYHATEPLAAFYRELDPGNRFNPGVGRMSKRADYSAEG